MGEVEKLRSEVRDLHYLTKAVLMALVGKDTLTYEIEAKVQDSLRREKRGSALRDLGLSGLARDRLNLELDLWTLEEVASESRDRLARTKGIGPQTLQQLDAAIAEQGLTWTEGG